MIRQVLVAPDKFKGTLAADEAARAIGRGLARGGIDRIEMLPVADGGEGTMDALVRALRGRVLAAEVSDALGRPVEAAFVQMPTGHFISGQCGLQLILLRTTDRSGRCLRPKDGIRFDPSISTS